MVSVRTAGLLYLLAVAAVLIALALAGCVVAGVAPLDLADAPDLRCAPDCYRGITGEWICLECPPPSLEVRDGP